MYLEPKLLYRRNAAGGGQMWSIEVHDWDLHIKHGTIDDNNNHGKLQLQVEEVPVGKAGRTRVEQVQSRVASRTNKQRDKGYVDSLSDAVKGTNGAGFIKPMLATPFKEVPETDLNKVYVQMKYDGLRCLVTKKNGVLHAYSRNGKPINSVDHILSELQDRLDEDATLDGELYAHGLTLQTINSLVRGSTKDTTQIRYMVYDTISDDPYTLRMAKIRSTLKGCSASSLVPTSTLSSDLDKALQGALDDGFEGLILRTLDTGYEAGKRSKSLIKVKRFLDDEFIAFDIHSSVDGHGIVSLFSKNGSPFTVSAPGTAAERAKCLIHKNEYIGKALTVKYANLTPDGIPFHPVAVAWRDAAD